MFAKLAADRRFQNAVLVFIVLAGVLAGVETSPALVAAWAGPLHALDTLVLVVFVVELLVKLGAVGWHPGRFFREPWNLFDFVIVAAAFLPVAGSSVAVLRLARLLRFLRLLRAIPRLQVLVGALLKSVPSMGYVALLLGVLFYAYGILGVGFFAANDPVRFGDLPTAMLSLFRCATGDAWSDVMYTQYYGCAGFGYDAWPDQCTQSDPQPVLASAFFVSFMLLGSMVTLNLLVGVIMNGMEETAKENAELDAEARGGSLTVGGELEALQRDLHALQERLATIGRMARDTER